jgi:predicted secreted protein
MINKKTRIGNPQIAILFLLAFAMYISSCKHSEITIMQGKIQNTYKLHIGQTCSVHLVSNFSTGYSWANDSSCRNTIQYGAMTFTTNSNNQDLQSFTYKAMEKGACTLRFYYLRPFEKNSTPSDSTIINIKVK